VNRADRPGVPPRFQDRPAVLYERSLEEKDPARRGLMLESVLARCFELAHYSVTADAQAGAPRQTDLLARYGPTTLLVECKWRTKAADMEVLDGLWARMGRTQVTVVGVLVSMSGFTSTVREAVAGRRKDAVLLLGRAEVERVVHDPRELRGLLERKLRALLDDAEVHVSPTADGTGGRAVDAERMPDPEEAVLSILADDGTPVPFVSCVGSYTSHVNALELPDPDWSGAGGTTSIALDLLIDAPRSTSVGNVLEEFHKVGWASPRAAWVLQQAERQWQGVGAMTAVEALAGWQGRYEAPGCGRLHHSEVLNLVDSCEGGFYALQAVVSAEPSRALLRCSVNFCLSGVPLDPEPVRHLVERLGTVTPASFRPYSRAVVRTELFEDEPGTLSVVGLVATQPGADGEEPEASVVGLVVENPWGPAAPAQPRGTGPGEWRRSLSRSEHVLVGLGSHHPVGAGPDSYTLRRCEETWTSEVHVVRLVADWP